MPDNSTTDRMERVREKARDESKRRWGHRKPFDENPPNHGPMDWLDDGMAAGFVLGAMWQAHTTLSDAEWEQAREDVARAMWNRSEWDISVRCGNAIKPWEWLSDEGKTPFHNMAEAAMRAVGLRKDGE